MNYFEPSKYAIRLISNELAQEMVVANHYLHRKASCMYAFGMYELLGGYGKGLLSRAVVDKLVGVIIYGAPASQPLCKGICGIEERNNVIELARLWVDDCVGRNAESWLVANTLKKIPQEIIVSFADSGVGHTGIIYQASNFIYTGLSAARADYVSKLSKHPRHNHIGKDGDSVLVERSRKHRYIYFNCTKQRKKELLSKLNYPITAYPKTNIGK